MQKLLFCRLLFRPARKCGHHHHQFLCFDRFGDVHLEAMPHRADTVFGSGVCRQRDGRRATAMVAVQSSHLGDQGQPVLTRHANVVGGNTIVIATGCSSDGFQPRLDPPAAGF